jgi:putative tricarboxylic transport membrane protein
MNDPPPPNRSAASTRTLELVVAALIFVFGLAVVYDSWRVGASWADDGPQAGYFPFYIGLLILISSGVTFARVLRNPQLGTKSFVSIEQLKMVLMLLAPSVIYVGLIDWLGIYVASALFIAILMMWLGSYSIAKAAPVALGVVVAFFLIFEQWFKVPLPKGPLEAALGLG